MESLIKDANKLIQVGNCLKNVVNILAPVYPEFSKVEIARIILNSCKIESKLIVRK